MTTTPSGSSRPCVSLPTALLLAYRRARATPEGATLPPLSHLLREAIAAALASAGIPVPESPATPRTAKATAARWIEAQRGR